jgi:hypothetical protein
MPCPVRCRGFRLEWQASKIRKTLKPDAVKGPVPLLR